MYAYFQSTELTKYYFKFSDFQVGCSCLLKCLWVNMLRPVIHSKWSVLLWFSHNYCTTRKIKSIFKRHRKEIFIHFLAKTDNFSSHNPTSQLKRMLADSGLKVLCHTDPQGSARGGVQQAWAKRVGFVLQAAHLGFLRAVVRARIVRGELTDFAKDKRTTDQGEVHERARVFMCLSTQREEIWIHIQASKLQKPSQPSCQHRICRMEGNRTAQRIESIRSNFFGALLAFC